MATECDCLVECNHHIRKSNYSASIYNTIGIEEVRNTKEPTNKKENNKCYITIDITIDILMVSSILLIGTILTLIK